MDFQDLNLECIDCHQSFLFSSGEQQFYERKGFKETPKRCKTCRDARKTRRETPAGGEAVRPIVPRGDTQVEAGDDWGNRRDDSGGANGNTWRAPRRDTSPPGPRANGAGASGGGNGGNARSGGGARETFDATCAACGTATRVPFRPAEGRPVYCRDCFGNRST